MANPTTNHPGRDGGGRGDLGGNPKGGEIEWQRSHLQKDSCTNEVMSNGRVHVPRKGENHVGTKKLRVMASKIVGHSAGSSQKRAQDQDNGELDRWPKMPSEKNGIASIFFSQSI
jgi:hypothetical protein